MDMLMMAGPKIKFKLISFINYVVIIYNKNNVNYLVHSMPKKKIFKKINSSEYLQCIESVNLLYTNLINFKKYIHIFMHSLIISKAIFDAFK